MAVTAEEAQFKHKTEAMAAREASVAKNKFDGLGEPNAAPPRIIYTEVAVKGYVAVIERNDHSERKEIPVPEGQSLDFDEGTASRRWLHPHLGSEWHLVEFKPASN